ncbi:hypothetical protein ACFQ14_09150 [Pseudahrensia aquimaris]|uniref:Uncharacterized protein n=1 Tax=Pseudahrensia aquimaris TaxID=744461 RepID=A0ABW3FII1_9HYPH
MEKIKQPCAKHVRDSRKPHNTMSDEQLGSAWLGKARAAEDITNLPLDAAARRIGFTQAEIDSLERLYGPLLRDGG